MSNRDELEDLMVEAFDIFACCSVVEELGFVKNTSRYGVYDKTFSHYFHKLHEQQISYMGLSQHAALILGVRLVIIHTVHAGSNAFGRPATYSLSL